MKKRTTIISYLLIAVLTAPQAVLAQAGSGSNRDWAAVMAAHPSEKLAIKLKSGQTVEGTLSSVSETGLALASSGKMVDIKQEEARLIYRITGAPAKKSVLIGAAIGAAGGAAGGAVVGAPAGSCKNAELLCLEKSKAIPLLAAVYAGIGALAGLAVGKVRHKRTVIYEAK